MASLPLWAQRGESARTLVVLPFENRSKAPGIEWIGEAFPEVLGQRMTSPTLFVIGRADRLYAFDRLGIPANLRPSRATLFRIAQELDVDYVVMGSYDFDGQTFTARAQLLDMAKLRMLPEAVESGTLVKLIDIQTALAWDVMRLINPQLLTSKNAFLAASTPIRLDAFENYVRGSIAAEPEERVRYFNVAVRLKPDYAAAILGLGKAHYEGREYGDAVKWLTKLPKSDPLAREANFFLGLAAYYLGDFTMAEQALEFVASRMPLTEVHNNLGVVASRRGGKDAVGHFERAAQADPNDPDYQFNLGVAMYRAGDVAGAGRQLREALRLRPGDGETSSLLDAVNRQIAGGSPPANSRLPLERVKRNYDETSFRQMALEIYNANERRMRGQPPRVHASFHIERGRELLSQGFVGEAEREFREASTLDQANAAAIAGLAAALEGSDPAAARAEANTALRLRASSDAYLVLARLELRDNNLEAASRNVERALELEPANATAAALKRTIAAKLAEKAQPLRQP